MKSLVGLLMCIAGVCLGLYVGLYLCFVGGIIDLIHQVRSPDLSASAVAWDIVRIMFAGVAGWISAFVLLVPGTTLMKK